MFGVRKRRENDMAELIKKQYGRVVSVELRNPSEICQERNWRKEFEGFCGVMHIYQSQHKSPYIYFFVIENHVLTLFKPKVESTTRLFNFAE